MTQNKKGIIIFLTFFSQWMIFVELLGFLATYFVFEVRNTNLISILIFVFLLSGIAFSGFFAIQPAMIKNVMYTNIKESCPKIFEKIEKWMDIK